MPTLLLFIDLPASVPFIPQGLSAWGGWRNTCGTSAANLASLITGTHVRQHGVVSEWEARPDGMLPRRAPRIRLMSPPLWELIPQSLAVGWAWTNNSRPSSSIIISPDYLKAPTSSTPLPGQTSPWSFSTALESLRITPEQLSESTLKKTGYVDSINTRSRLAETLSAHSIASKLIRHNQVCGLAAVYLGFTMPPQQKGTVARFLKQIVDHYLQHCKGWNVFCVVRSWQANERTSHDSIWGLGNKRNEGWIKTPVEFSQTIASAFELQIPFSAHHTLPEKHWQELKNRYRISSVICSRAIDANTRINQEVKSSLDTFGLLPAIGPKAAAPSAHV